MSIDSRTPHPARMYDYMLGGGTNFASDRRLAEEMSAPLPGGLDFGRALARRNRAYLGRVVRHLSEERGIRQFLDIGAGIPATVNTHEIAQDIDPTSRVVYVDRDPIVLAYAHERLGSTSEGACDYVHADLGDVEQIVEAADETLDLDQPVGLLLVAVLHLVADASDPYGVVSRLVDTIPSGSYLAVSHFTADIFGDEMRKMTEIYTEAGETMVMRSRDGVARFLDGLEIVDPGVVLIEDWHPDGRRHDPLPMYGGVAAKR